MSEKRPECLREKRQPRGGESGESPVEPGRARRGPVKAVQDVRPEIATQRGAGRGRQGLVKKAAQLKFVHGSIPML